MPFRQDVGTYQGLYSSHHSSHHRNFPPRHYRDLNRKDLSILAPVLAAQPGQSASQDQMTKDLISQLPSYLRSKVPWVSTFCHSHRKLNPPPLVSLWNAIQHDMQSELDDVWFRADIAAPQSHFVGRVAQHPWHAQPRCVACSLSAFAGDNDLIIGTAAMTLATLSHRNWEKSKRAQFLQGLLRGRVDARHATGPIAKMFEVADSLRLARSEIQNAIENGLLITHRRAGSYSISTPRRPSRTTAQEDHVAITVASMSDDSELESVNQESAMPFPNDTTNQTLGEGTSETYFANVANAQVLSDDVAAQPIRGVPSSVYSRDVTGDMPRPSRRTTDTSVPSILREDSIIELHRHPVFPKPEKTQQAPATPEPAQASGGRRIKRATHRLTPIWIPRSHYGGEAALRTSALWKRRFNREPKFRLGKDGEIKRPFDSVSDVDGTQGDDVWYQGADRWI